MNLYKFYILLMLFFFGYPTPKTNVVCESRYEIQVLHPGIDLTEPVAKTLVRSSCNLEEPTEFYMDVESVVCGDSQCRIDVIRMYWDELGFYKRLELPSDVELEKAAGASFSAADYQKLDSILSDRKSTLKDVQKYEVTGSETSEGVDALSGATIALDTKSYVKGAVWTCYTLWHWANGNTTNAIRNLTGDSMTVDAFENYLKEESLEHKMFALEQLIRLKHQNAKTIEAILQLTSTKNQKLQKRIIEYVEQLPNDHYFKSIEYLLDTKNDKLALLALRSLLESETIPSKEHCNSLSNRLSNWDSYQQIDLFLNILEKKDSISQKIIGYIFPLLERSDFLIARRAYWFLSKQELSTQEKNKLQTFYTKNSEKL